MFIYTLLSAVSSKASLTPSASPSQEPVTMEGLVEAGADTIQKTIGLPPWVTKVALVILTIAAGFFLLRFGRKMIKRFVASSTTKSKSSRSLRQQETFASLLSSVLTYIMYFVIATIVLSILGVNISSILTVAGIGGVAIGFGAQTLVKDIISGIFLWTEGNITVGEKITVNNMHGTVEAVTLRTTSIRDFNGDLYVVPNGDIRTVINTSRNFKRAIIDMRLSYEEDLEYMLTVLEDEMLLSKEAIPQLKETPQVMGINAIQGDCIVVRISALCSASSYNTAARELRKRLLLRFKQENIIVPHAPVIATPRLDAMEELNGKEKI